MLRRLPLAYASLLAPHRLWSYGVRGATQLLVPLSLQAIFFLSESLRLTLTSNLNILSVLSPRSAPRTMNRAHSTPSNSDLLRDALFEWRDERTREETRNAVLEDFRECLILPVRMVIDSSSLSIMCKQASYKRLTTISSTRFQCDPTNHGKGRGIFFGCHAFSAPLIVSAGILPAGLSDLSSLLCGY